MAIEHTLDVERSQPVTDAARKPGKLSVYELIALDPEVEQQLLDHDIDTVLHEGYEILEVIDLYESNEAED